MNGAPPDPFVVSAKKRALIEATLRKEGVISGKTDQMIPRATRGHAPLSFAQQRLWFFDQFEPGSALYNLMAPVLFTGSLDVGALEEAFNQVVERHEALRTTFDFREGQPVQIVAPSQRLKMCLVDLAECTEEEQQPRMKSLMEEQSKLPFDLKHGPLLRITLLRLNQEKHVLLLAVHHIVSDAWSTGLLIRELEEIYASIRSRRTASLPDLPIQYSDFAVWQRQWLQGAVLEEHLGYWKSQLGGALTVLDLPADRSRPAVQTFKGSSVFFAVPLGVSQSLRSLSQSLKASLFMTLLAAFKVLLHRYSGLEDVLVGTPIANRQRQEIESLIGFFTNTLAIRTDLSGDPPFRDLLKRVRETLLDAYAHQDLPFEYLVEQLHPERTLSHSPLVQVMFVLENTPGTELKFLGVTATPLPSEFSTAKFDLTIYLDDRSDQIHGLIEYNTDLFDVQRMERMCGHFQTLLESIVANPLRPISDLNFLTDGETGQLLREWNRTKQPYSEVCAHELFEQQAERTPDSIALVDEKEEEKGISYRQLNARSNRIARHLRSLDVRPGAIVGILMDRSPQMIAGILGILKAGATCLPLNPSYPVHRLAFMLEDSEAAAVLTEGRSAANLPQTTAHIVDVEARRWQIDACSDDNLQLPADSKSGIYVIYTSGSTGVPKGVMMPHRALVNLVEWHKSTASHTGRVLQFASLTFDVSFQEVFSTLSVGGTLVLAPEPIRVDVAALGKLIAQKQVERFHLPVVMLQRLAEEYRENPQPLASLRELIVGGEQLQISAPITRLFERLQECRLYNHYGPSETHVVTCFPLTGASTEWPLLPPLGRPIANTQAYVLDSHFQPVPIGVPGELYVGGDCIAQGYLKRPELTAERFVPDPFGDMPGARLYKTGDLVRYLPSGDLEFLGRNDFQVKIRGMRIELGEIEVELRRHPGVREAVVMVHQDGTAADKRLAAWIVPNSGQEVTPGQLRDFLRERLPEHMVPSHIVMLQSFPLTSSGKINRLALPAPDKDFPAASYLPPQTAVEKVLAAIFEEVLGRKAVGILDNFFDLGGHSILATQIASRVREAFRMELPVRLIFEEPTVGGLARTILAGEEGRAKIQRTAELLLEFQCGDAEYDKPATGEIVDSTDASSGSSAPQERISPSEKNVNTTGPATKLLRTAPLSFAQQRLWFLDQYEPQSTLYNLPAAICLKGRLNLRALADSLNGIVRRHESLRTTFVFSDERPVQQIHDAISRELTVVDLQGSPTEEKERTRQQLIAEEAARPFDLSEGPLLRTRLIRMSPEDHIFLVTMHHIVSDGWSLQIFIRELAALYNAVGAGERSPLSDLSMQYADFATWQRQWLQGAVLSRQLDYWKRQLADAPPMLEIPTDRPRPVHKTFNGAALSFQIPQALTQQVVQLSRAAGATPFMTLLAVFYVLLHRYSGQEDIMVGTPIANRNRKEIEPLIGFFVNTLVMRTRCPAELTFRELLGRVRETCLAAYTCQDVPFEKLVEELQPERSLSHSPLFQAMFHLQNVLTGELELSGLSVSAEQIEIKQAKFDLSLAVQETVAGLTGILNYNTDLFDPSTAARMASHYQRLIESVTAAPDEQVSCLLLLDPEEKQEILVAWNDCKQDCTRPRLVHEALEDQSQLTPDNVAVRFENHTLTYCELNRRANQLAHRLRRLGVRPETIVGICVERSLEMMVGLLGIMKAGAAYLPLDPADPKERLAFMLDDANVRVLVLHHVLASQLPHSAELHVYLDGAESALHAESGDNPEPLVRPENLAYVIYTSGSTGKPKGIMIEHRGLANYVHWASEFMFDNDGGVVPAVQSLTFDGSLKQIFAPLLRGLAIWILSKTDVADPFSLMQNLSTQQDIRFSVVPSLWKEILDTLESGQSSLPAGAITRAFIGGEELPWTLADRSFALMPDLLLWNFYGPSEITATATAALVRLGEPINIGRPIAGKKIHILDDQLQPVPPGVSGEIYIGREGLARGYLQRPGLTAASFIPDPFSEEPGARLYRTRDRARYLPDGRIEFQGRFDHQVKVRGFRIELGEIEAVLQDHSQVKEAVAVTRNGNDDERRIVAYIVPSQESVPAWSELRAFLKQRLPEYMIPSAWMSLEKLPLMPNGKLNRAALPEPEQAKREIEASCVPPRNAVEEMLRDIFTDTLSVTQIGIHDNFFELGGHSLLATRVVARIRKLFKTELTLRCFFDGPTIAKLAAALVAQEREPGKMEAIAALFQKLDSLSAEDLEELLRRKKAKAGG